MTFAADLRDRACSLWHFQRIRGLVRARLQLGPHVRITVSECYCPDPACPGWATRVAIMSLDLRQRAFLIHRPAALVTGSEIAQLCQ